MEDKGDVAFSKAELPALPRLTSGELVVVLPGGETAATTLLLADSGDVVGGAAFEWTGVVAREDG